MNKKPIIMLLDGDELALKTKWNLVKGNVENYVLYFSGIDRHSANIAVIESLTMKQYVPVSESCLCVIPECFNICDEIKISLKTLVGDAQRTTNSIFLYFK